MPLRILLGSGSATPEGSRLRAFHPWTLKGRRKAYAPKTKHPAAATKPHQVLPMAIAGVRSCPGKICSWRCPKRPYTLPQAMKPHITTIPRPARRYSNSSPWLMSWSGGGNFSLPKGLFTRRLNLLCFSGEISISSPWIIPYERTTTQTRTISQFDTDYFRSVIECFRLRHRGKHSLL
jgi:hypothetical protein